MKAFLDRLRTFRWDVGDWWSQRPHMEWRVRKVVPIGGILSDLMALTLERNAASIFSGLSSENAFLDRMHSDPGEIGRTLNIRLPEGFGR